MADHMQHHDSEEEKDTDDENGGVSCYMCGKVLLTPDFGPYYGVPPICSMCSYMYNRAGRRVGVDVESSVNVISQPGYTDGCARTMSMVELSAELAKIETMTPPDTIGSGAYGSVTAHEINGHAQTRLTQIIRESASRNSGVQYVHPPPLPATLKYAKKTMKHDDDGAYDLSVSTLHEFAVRDMDDPGVIAIGGGDIVLDQTNGSGAGPMSSSTSPSYYSTLSMDMAKYNLTKLIKKAADEHGRQAYVDRVGTNAGPVNCFTPNEYKLLAYQAIRAVAYVNSRLVIHGDIKSENFLVTATSAVPPDVARYMLQGRPNAMPTFKVLKLTDFGLSVLDYTSPHQVISVYTTMNRPPELLLGAGGPYEPLVITDPSAWASINRVITNKAEVWALGAVLYEMATGSFFGGTWDARWPSENFDANYGAHTVQRLMEIYGTQGFARVGAMSIPRDPDRQSRQLQTTWFPALGGVEYTNTLINLGYDPTDGFDFDRDLAAYPGLSMMLRRMLHPNPLLRAELVDILADPFFTSDNVGDMVRRTINPRLLIPLRMNPDPVTLAYSNGALMNYYMSVSTKHNGRSSVPLALYGQLAQQLGEVARRVDVLIPYQLGSSAAHEIESKAYALLASWLSCVGPRIGGLGGMPVPQLEITARAIYVIAFKLVNNGYTIALDATKPNGAIDDFDANSVIKTEHSIIKSMDFDLNVVSTYDIFRAMVPYSNRARGPEVIARDMARVMCMSGNIVNALGVYSRMALCFDILSANDVTRCDVFPLPYATKYPNGYDPQKLYLWFLNAKHICKSVRESELRRITLSVSEWAATAMAM